MKRNATDQKCGRGKGLGTIHVGPHIHPHVWWDLNRNKTAEKSTDRFPFIRTRNNR